MTIKHFLKIAIVFSSRKKRGKEGRKETTEHSITGIYIYLKMTAGKKDTCHMITSYYQENKNYKYFSGVQFQVLMELYRITKSSHEHDNQLPLGNLQNSPGNQIHIQF